MGKRHLGDLIQKYDPYAKMANPNSDFAFYGTLAKELAQTTCLG